MCSVLKIAAVFATMNRAETAVSCVMALARQTRPPDLVVVADNVSCDDTVAVLNALTDLPFELIVHQMPENSGNAGGVEVVMDLAFSHGADAVWILDDDSWPRPNALEKLLEGTWDPRVVRHPLQIDPDSGKLTWPLQITDGNGGWKLIWEESEMPNQPNVTSRITWTGALLPREVREVVGPVNGALFIRGEDEDYPLRIELAGFSQEAIRASVMDHPGPKKMVHLQCFGKSFFFEKGLSDWKLYYKVRNMIWLKRRYEGASKAILMAATYGFAATLIDGPKCLPILRRAILDGWRGKLGKMT